jgi:DNA-binding IclR family transcriptional regulator
MSELQTLSRGIRVLEIVGREAGGVSIGDLAAALGVHRAVVYRLVATLESHLLVVRGPDGRISLGGGIVALAAGVEPQLRALAPPILREMAEATGATAFLCVGQGEDCVALRVVEPEAGVLRVSYRVGTRHPISRGAAGLAIASLRPERPEDDARLRQVRAEGYSVTRGELQPGAVGVAAPLAWADRALVHEGACVGVVALQDLDIPLARDAVLRGARTLALRLR